MTVPYNYGGASMKLITIGELAASIGGTATLIVPVVRRNRRTSYRLATRIRQRRRRIRTRRRFRLPKGNAADPVVDVVGTLSDDTAVCRTWLDA